MSYGESYIVSLQDHKGNPICDIDFGELQWLDDDSVTFYDKGQLVTYSHDVLHEEGLLNMLRRGLRR